jgi:hypothetical protein
MVWRQQKRRVCCTGLLGRGRIIIYSFSRMSLVSQFNSRVQDTPRVLHRVCLSCSQADSKRPFQYNIETRSSMRFHEPLPMRPSQLCLRLGQAVGQRFQVQL